MKPPRGGLFVPEGGDARLGLFTFDTDGRFVGSRDSAPGDFPLLVLGVLRAPGAGNGEVWVDVLTAGGDRCRVPAADFRTGAVPL